MSRVRTPSWSVVWDDRDVTRDLTPLLLSASYQDSLDAEGATIELRFSNTDGRWLDEWAPSAGQRIGISMGYVGESLVRPGTFEIDEFSVGPQVCTVSAISSRGVSLRTRSSAAYESQSIVYAAVRDGTFTGNIAYTMKGAQWQARFSAGCSGKCVIANNVQGIRPGLAMPPEPLLPVLPNVAF